MRLAASTGCLKELTHKFPWLDQDSYVMTPVTLKRMNAAYKRFLQEMHDANANGGKRPQGMEAA